MTSSAGEQGAPLVGVDVDVGGLVLVGGDLGDHRGDLGGVGRGGAADGEAGRWLCVALGLLGWGCCR